MVVVVIWIEILINRKRRGHYSTGGAARPASLPNTSPPACVKTEAPPEEPEKPEKPASVPPDMSHCDLSVPPPPYKANVTDEPPSYQSVIANS